MNRLLMATAAVAFICTGLCAQGKPLGRHALVGGKVLLPSGEYLDGATVLIEDGRIKAIGKDIEVPADASVEKLKGSFVYPGMLDMGNRVGLTEIGSVRGSIDFRENGNVNPHIKALTAVNPHSDHIAVARVNGVLYSLTGPSSGLISGQPALVAHSGWTATDMAVQPSAGLVIRFPRVRRRDFSKKTEKKMGDERESATERLDAYFDKAREYMERLEKAGDDLAALTPDLALEAMIPVLKGERRLIVEANDAETIVAAVRWSEKQKLPIVLRGLREGWKVAEFLAEKQVPCILGSLYQGPGREDVYDAVYAGAGVMARKGVKLAFSSGDSSNSRNLPYHAAMAVSFGMPEAAALRALTSGAAEMLGAEGIGRLEVGAEATLFISNGDILDPRSKVSKVVIRGSDVGIESRHTKLRDRFLPLVGDGD